MDERLPPNERLKKKNDIDAVFRGGRRLQARLLRIHVQHNHLAYSRFAVSVPRKLCGAVFRNRWKRLLRESFRRNKAAIGPGLDIVAVPSVPPGELKRPQVEFVLIQLVRKHRGA